MLDQLYATLTGTDDVTRDGLFDRKDMRLMGLDAYRMTHWPWPSARAYAEEYPIETGAMLVLMGRVVNTANEKCPNLVESIMGDWAADMGDEERDKVLSTGRIVPLDFILRN